MLPGVVRPRIAMLKLVALLTLLMLGQPLAWSDEAPIHFDSPKQEAQYQQLLHEVRCLVCQNQSLAESHADLAMDLRQEIAQALRNGQTPEQVKARLVQRYGDFVLYRPPVRNTTLVLWFGPALLLLGGLAVVWRVVRRRGDES
jgi:cytochrome c-type biogenesis protein CcmH